MKSDTTITIDEVLFSQEELDEFVTPEGEVFYSFRSIVYDSWLIWSDALPDVQDQRQELTQDTYDNIICLADSPTGFISHTSSIAT